MFTAMQMFHTELKVIVNCLMTAQNTIVFDHELNNDIIQSELRDWY